MTAALDLESPTPFAPSRLGSLLSALDSVFERPAATPAPALLLEGLREELCSELIQLARRSGSDPDAFASLGVCLRLLGDFLEAHERLRLLLEAHEQTESRLRQLRHARASD